MRSIIKLFLSQLLACFNDIYVNMKFVIVIASYKNAKWYKKNLLSALSQKHPSFRILYTDDCSPDNTGGLVEEFARKHDKKNLIELIRNTDRKGALKNIYDMIHRCDDDEVIVTLDGDDWFPDSNVLQRLEKVYAEDVWMTYGQYRRHPDNSIGCNSQVPPNVIKNNSYRTSNWCTSHLRTFYAWLFKRIKEDDLKHKGKFFSTAWDLPMMFPMLEMSGTRHRFIPRTMYIYNWENPINDSKVNLKLQEELEAVSRAMPKYSVLSKRP